jgi:general secretion pathway protein B
VSYILDALRKAERDRNLGRTPSLGDVTSPSARAPTSNGPSKRVLALIALVFGMLALAILLWPDAPESPAPPLIAAAPPAPTPVPVPAASPPPAVAPSEETAAASQALPEEGAVDPTLDADVAAESIDDLMDDAGAEAPLDTNELPLDESVSAAPKPPSVKRTPAAPVDPAPTPAVVAEAPAPEPEDVPADGIPLLRNMPSDYRGAFPELRVDVHVYDDDPERRWTLINGKKAVEGTTLAEGPTISEIRPDGIVFDFRGQSALFPLGH